MSLPGRLPFTVPVLPGEHFAGWFERLADDLGVGPGHLVEEVGLGDTPGGTMANYGIGLSARQEERLAAATGMPPGTWAPTLVTALDGVAAHLDGYDPERPESTLTVFGKSTWLVSPGDRRWCPACLSADGTWRLTWCTRFEFGCPQHGVALVDRCHACGRGVRHQMTKSRRARVAPYGCVACGADTRHAAAPAIDRVSVEAAADIRSALEGAPARLFGEPCQPDEFLDALRLLVTTVHTTGLAGAPGRAPGARSPSNAYASVTALTEAWRLTTLAADAVEDQAVQWWRDAYRDRSDARRLVRRHRPTRASDVMFRAIDRS